MALTVIVVLGALAGCGSSGTAGSTASPKPTRTTAGDDCPALRTGGTPVFFGEDSTGYLAGYVYGSGSVGIVFAHEAEDTSCDWMPMARTLAKQGYITMVFDFAEFGASTLSGNDFPAYVNEAADLLGSRGAKSVVLIGSSMGGASVLAAAPTTKLPVNGVIALSSPIAFGGSDAIGQAPLIKVPLLIECGTFDINFVEDVKQIYAAAKATKHKQLLFTDSAAHGHQLVEAPTASPDMVKAFMSFLATYAPPSA